MKTIGMIGGTGWESTLEYYRLINQSVAEHTDFKHSARMLLHSVDFFEISSRMEKQDYEGLEKFLTELALSIENNGADCLMLCANTLHVWADQIAGKISIPLLHIADATAVAIKASGLGRVGLLGTKPTMEWPFYKERLADKHGIEVLIPTEEEREYIQQMIFTEFFKGVFTDEARRNFLEIIGHLTGNGAEGIILGCTEIPLLINQSHTPVPLFDTLELHAKAAADFFLSA